MNFLIEKFIGKNTYDSVLFEDVGTRDRHRRGE